MSKTKMKNSIAGDIFMKPPSSSSILSHFLVFALTCCSFNATLMVEELRGEMMIVVGFLHRLIIPQHVQPMETIDSSLRIFMAQVTNTYYISSVNHFFSLRGWNSQYQFYGVQIVYQILILLIL